MLRWSVVAGIVVSARLALAAQPVIEPPVSPARARVGESLEIAYVVRWDGPPETYVVRPPTAPTLDWGRAEFVGLSVKAEDAATTATLILRVFPEQGGRFDVPPVSISLAAEGGSGAETPLESASVSLTVKGHGGRWALALPVAVVGVVGLVIAAFRWTRRGRETGGDATLSPLEQAREALHAARRRRLDGDFYACYRKLAEAAARLPEDEESRRLKKTLEDRTRQVGYQGVRPSDDELEGDMRDIERALARWKETTTP